MDNENPNLLQGNKLFPRLGIAIVVLIILNSYVSLFIYALFAVDYASYLYLDATISYVLIVLSIIIFTPNRLEPLCDHFSLWAIILACLLAAASHEENMLIYRGIFVFLGMALSIYIITNQKKIKMPSLKSVYIGLLWSISAVLVTALVYALLDQTYIYHSIDLMQTIANEFLFQLAFVSIVEEALFRGLIFSFLVMNGYKENTALFVQAVLFWGMHYTDINNPILFFVIVPIVTLFMTLIVKKYKMLYLSIMMHTFLNIFTTLLTALINRYLF
jgi:membrane protease YdiL (CAAX protease family)